MDCKAHGPVDAGTPHGPGAERTLLRRFPNEAAYRGARDRALAGRQAKVDHDRATLKLLAAQRETLQHDSLRPAGEPLPPGLESALKANQAALDTQAAALARATCELSAEQAAWDRAEARLRNAWK